MERMLLRRCFQNILTQALQGLKGVQNIADDIIVFGGTREEHDAALEACLKRLEEKGLILNFEKCQFLRENLNFFSLVHSKEGKIVILSQNYTFQSLRNSFQVKRENFEGPSSHLSLAKQVEYDFLNKPQMCTQTDSQYDSQKQIPYTD